VSKTSAQDVAPPELPGYLFIKHIGAGGNAQVYLYEQNLPHRKVAVKVLNESALSDAARRRFTAEANVTADLAHRHIVQVFDANVTADGRPYIVMPYYPQPNLSVRARRSHFSVADVLRVGIQIGSAVETSHRRDVLHRDIKPQNILTDSYGEPALTDFGIATTKGGDGPEGLSVPWSPPEILFGTSPSDQRADVYSLGATLWHLLVGRSPFEQPGGDNGTFALMGRIKSEAPPRTQRTDVPDSLERLLRQAMAKDPAARPQSAMELIRGLQSIEQELRLPLTHPILPADESPADTRGGDTIARPRGRAENTFLGRASGLTDLPPAGGVTEGAWGPGGFADPRTHGGQPVRGHTQGGHPQAGQTQYAGTQPGQPGPPGPQQWGQTIPPWGAGADPRTHGVQAAWSGGTYEATVSRGTRSPTTGPAGTEDDQTRRRAPMRVDPWGQAGQAGQVDDDRTRTRGPVRLDPWGAAGPGPDFPEFQLGGRESTTMARPAPPHPGNHAAAGKARPSGRVLALGGGVLVAVVAVVAYLTLTSGNGPSGNGQAEATQSAASVGGGSALGPGATAPGEPTVKAQSAGGTQVRFSWTYTNPATGDTFRWQRVSGSAGAASGATSKPELLVTLPAGQSVCIVVQVRRAAGQASTTSQPVCWPNLLIHHNE
jgi:tRNA A-37 threonylcarbamoyl transferase component Bud32